MIPPPLAPMGLFGQFVSYMVSPKADGKTDKIPLNPRSLTPANPHEPHNWASYEVCEAATGRVGFVFTDDDPFFFLDIDNCLLPDGQWSPLAVRLCTMFAGACVEVSLSGRGLHIFGTGLCPPHTCKCEAMGLDLSTAGRFAAVGHQPGRSGSSAQDCTDALRVLVAEYFSRDPAVPEPVTEWSSVPVPEWRGPADDADLIRRLRASASAAAAFGSKATPDQLWTADAQALTQAYPSSTGQAYDASSADAALAAHLAFWTGKNCERIKRLMMLSLLMRDKWQRDDYLQRTILAACSLQSAVCQDKVLDFTIGGLRAVDGEEETFLTAQAQVERFTGCTYVADINRIMVPGGHSYNKEQFDAMFGGYIFAIDSENSKVTSSAWDCFTKSRLIRFNKANCASFRPEREPGTTWLDGNQIVANSYWPIAVRSVPGNVLPFTDHVARILPNPNDQAILLAYMAAVVQHKGVKFQWCPLLQGTRGNGKTLFSKCLIEAVGRQHCHSPKAAEITEKFNSWQENKIFIAVEDIYVPRERIEMLEILKPMITSNWQEIRGMQKDKVSRYVCCNFMLNSNHRDAIRHTADNRSLCVFFTEQQTVEDLARCGMDGDYFPTLYNWLHRDGYAIVTDYLQNYNIPPELNPAMACHRAPSTSSTKAAIETCRGSFEQEISEAIEGERVGFKDGWISSTYLKALLKEIPGHLRISAYKRTEAMKDLGYVHHPGLKNGQATIKVAPDNCKPILYIKDDHKSLTMRSPVEISLRYQRAQLREETANDWQA